MMNDMEVRVRAEAARMLGCFTNVSEMFLMQTLDKKLVKGMKVVLIIFNLKAILLLEIG